MNNEYHGDDDHTSALPANPAELHAGRAREQAARFQADLAIARWSGAAGEIIPARAAWLTDAQDQLQQWLAAGGFSQQEQTPSCDSAALPFPGSRPLFYTLFRNARSTAD